MNSMAYQEYQKYHKKVAAGGSLIGIGIPAFSVGLPFLIMGLEYGDMELGVPGSAVTGVGFLFILVGSIEIGTCNKHMQKSYQYYINGEKQTATLNFHPYFDNHNTMGVGLTIRF